MHPRIFLAVWQRVSGAVAADSFDINLNDDSIQAIYATDWRTAELAA